MNNLTTIGRVIYALPFAVFGVMHFMNASQMAGYVPVPGGIVWVYVTGAAMVLAAIGIITKIMGSWAALGLALLLLIYVFAIHVPATMKDMQSGMGNLLKDLALAGGALAIGGMLRREGR